MRPQFCALFVSVTFFLQVTQADIRTKTERVQDAFYPISLTNCSIENRNGYIQVVTRSVRCQQFKTYRYKKVPAQLFGLISYSKDVEETLGEPAKFFYKTQSDQATFSVGLDKTATDNASLVSRLSVEAQFALDRVKNESRRYDGIDAALSDDLGKGLNMAAQGAAVSRALDEYRAISARLRLTENDLSRHQNAFQFALEQAFQNCIQFQQDLIRLTEKRSHHNQCK